MASREQLRAMFNGMDTVQKSQFISNLKKSVEGSGNTENAQFLDECIAQYNEELEAAAIQEESVVEPLIERTSEIAAQELEPESEPEFELESEPEFKPTPEPEFEPEPVDVLHDDSNGQGSALERIETPAASEKEIDNIANDIYGLVGNIRHNMGIIETISSILSGAESEVAESEIQANRPESALTLASAGAYEHKIDYIDARISEVAESIRRDISVIESISALLSGAGTLIVGAAAQAEKSGQTTSNDSNNAFDLQKKNDSVSSRQIIDADASNNQEPYVAETAVSIFSENEIDNILKEFSELVESIRYEISSLIYAVKDFSDVAENMRHVLSSRKIIETPQPISGSSIADSYIADNNAADNSIAMVGKNDTELDGNIPNDITPSKTASKIKRSLHGIKLWIFIPIALCIAAVIASVYFILPITRWVALAMALAWLGLSFYKKPIRIAGYEVKVETNKKMPIIASAIALIFVFVLPIINGIFGW